MATRPNIPAGDYDSIDTQDGWVVVKDVPLLGPVPKGEQGCPEDIGEKQLAKFALTSQKDADARKYIAPAHKSHHKLFSPKDPDFLGFVLPKRAGKLTHGDGTTEDALFGDLKMPRDKFDLALEGKLPYISAEAKWSENRISSVAVMDSMPPKYKFPLFIPKAPRVDPTARFEVDLKDLAQMADEQQTCPHCAEKDKQIQELMAKPPHGGNMPTAENRAPVEPTPAAGAAPVARMSDDPAYVAKMAALEDSNAALKKRLDERDAKEAAKARETKALAELADYQLGDAMRAQVAQFADAGQEKLDGLVRAIKEIAVKRPPSGPSDFGAAPAVPVTADDPSLAKFADKGPVVMQHAQKLLGEYKAVAQTKGGEQYTSRMTPERHVEMGLRRLKAEGVI